MTVLRAFLAVSIAVAGAMAATSEFPRWVLVYAGLYVVGAKALEAFITDPKTPPKVP